MDFIRAFLSVLLSFSIAFPPQTFAAIWESPSEEQINEAKKHLAPEEQEALDKILRQVEALQESFADPSGAPSDLDDFDLIQQDVVDARLEKINADIEKIKTQDFATRRQEEVTFLKDQATKNPSRTIEFIGKMPLQAAADLLSLDPQKDLLNIIEAAYTNDEVATIFEITPEDVEHFVNEELPPRRLYRMNLKVNVMKVADDDEGIVQTLNQKDAEGSTAASFNKNNIFKGESDSTYRFDITTSSGEIIHRFNRPVSAVGFYGRFLVYIPKDGFNEEDQKFSLRFIDLDYFKGAVGNTPLAAFELPISSKTQLESISIKDGALAINEKTIPYAGFTYASDIFQAYFNIKVALLDPKTASSAGNLIKELVYYKDQALKSMDQMETQMINSALDGAETMNSVVDDMVKKLEVQAAAGPNKAVAQVPEKLKAAFVDQPEMLLTFNPTIKVIEDDVLSKKRLTQVNRSIMVSRQFFSRLHLLMAKLNHPQPMGSPKIVQGMIMLAESTFKGDWAKAKQNWQDLKQHPVISYGRFGAPALAAAALGATISDSFALTIYETLQMGKDHVLGYLEHTGYGMNFIKLGGQAVDTALEGPKGAIDYLFGLTSEKTGVANYFTSENLPKLGILGGAMAGLVLSIYGSLHITANVMTTLRYFSRHKGWINKARSEGSSRLGAYRLAFIKYQNALKLYYDKGLAQAEAAAAGSKSAVKFNAAQDEVVDEVLAEIKRRPGFFGRIWNSLRGSDKAIAQASKDLQDAGDQSEEFTEGLKKNSHLNQITTLRSAFRQFALSYPSTIITSRFNGTLWNYWFMIRTFALSPRSWPMFLTYPELFRVGIDGQKDRVHMPSKFNGGYRTDIDNFKFVFRNMSTDARLKDLKVFEKSILPMEALAYEVALQNALEALIKEVKDPKQLKAFFDSTALPKANLPPSAVMGGASPSTGIRSISDAKVQKLSKENQTFFRAVFNRLYEKTTETYLRQFMAQYSPEAVESASNVAELKDVGLGLGAEMIEFNRTLSGENGKVVRGQMNDIAKDLLKDGQIVDQSRSVATSFSKFTERMLLNAEHQVVQRLDPNKPQINRFKTAERQLGNLKAVIRAVNAMATEIIMEKGMGLITVLVMYSAVTSGMLAPLQPEMFGPDSWFYGSRYLFLNGFATGVIMSALASVWMKVQMDDRIDSTGAFDSVSTAQDRDRSYLRYYMKSFWKNPANKWSGNQWNSMRIAWANMSAAFVTIAVTNFITLGRFDLGAFLTGYLIVYLTPLSGIDYKIDQTHELASRWQASQVMKKLRTHPKMLNWINTNVLKKRVPHSMFSTSYNFFMGPFVSLYELMDTPEYGKRSFLNLLFNGYQPEEIVSGALQKINKYFSWIPGVEHVTSVCESLLTNNNTALDPSKLINPPVPPN